MRCWFGRKGVQAAIEAIPRAPGELDTEFDIVNGGKQRVDGYDSGERHPTDCATKESRDTTMMRRERHAAGPSRQ
jgi:hypothetical protein